METTTLTSLYQRLGAADGITALVDDIVEMHMNNPKVSARFRPYLEQPEMLAQVKKHTCDFFGMGSGGPEVYTGRDMVTAHRGMNISEEEYMHVVDDIMTALDKHGMDEETKKDVLAIAWSLRVQIMHQ
ncbi:MAG: group 1 truncated hemoglobin [Bacteroidetes bacterium]|nr:group 1 truncated hemoglobin [Bacteroidota bacterium]